MRPRHSGVAARHRRGAATDRSRHGSNRARSGHDTVGLRRQTFTMRQRIGRGMEAPRRVTAAVRSRYTHDTVTDRKATAQCGRGSAPLRHVTVATRSRYGRATGTPRHDHAAIPLLEAAINARNGARVVCVQISRGGSAISRFSLESRRFRELYYVDGATCAPQTRKGFSDWGLQVVPAWILPFLF